MNSSVIRCLRVKNNLLNVAILLLLSMLVYFNSFGNPFVWDDEIFIVNNAEIRELKDSPAFFLEGMQNLYRPLRTVLYAATYHFSGANPVGYHLVGKTLNALTVCTLYALLVLLFGSRQGAFWGALLFALHPLHTDRVTNMTASFDILGDFLWLSAFACYVALRRGFGKKYYAGSLALFSLGLFSSETAAVTPIVIILYDMTLGWDKKDSVASRLGGMFEIIRPKLTWGPYFAILFGFLLLRFSVLGVLSRTGGSAINPDFFGNLVTMGGVVAQYFKLMVFPWPLVPIHEVEQAVRPYSFSLLASATGIASALVAALLYLRKRPDAAFSFLWFFAVLSPNLNIIPAGTLMAERYVYIPSAMLSFFVTLSFIRTEGENKRRLAVFFGLAAFAFFTMTAARNRVWHAENSLWASAIDADPLRSDAAVSNFAIMLNERGMWVEAERLMISATKNNDNKPLTLATLGERYLFTGRFDDAEKAFNKILRNPKVQYRAMYNLATICIRRGNYAEAEKILAEIIRQRPDGPETLNSYGVVLYEMRKPGWQGKFVLAYVASQKIERMEGKPGWSKRFITGRAIPGNVRYLVNLANFYRLSGANRSALHTARIALSVEPDNQQFKKIVDEIGGSHK